MFQSWLLGVEGFAARIVEEGSEVPTDIDRKRGTKARPKIKTMEEFSAASGISRATVSKYFNDPDSVRPSTRERIEKATKTLRYRPNLFAVNFNRKNRKTLGMIVPSLTDPFFAGLVERVELRAMQDGFWTIVLSSHGERAMEVRAIQTILSLRVAGGNCRAPGDVLGHGASQGVERFFAFGDARRKS